MVQEQALRKKNSASPAVGLRVKSKVNFVRKIKSLCVRRDWKERLASLQEAGKGPCPSISLSRKWCLPAFIAGFERETCCWLCFVLKAHKFDAPDDRANLAFTGLLYRILSCCAFKQDTHRCPFCTSIATRELSPALHISTSPNGDGVLACVLLSLLSPRP